MLESALHSSQVVACSKDSVLQWHESPGKIHPWMAQGSRANFVYKKSCFFSFNTVKMQRLPFLLPTSLSGADAIVTIEQRKVSLMYRRNWKQKAGFKCIFAMIQSVWFGMLWLCLILWSYYMLIDLTFFFFYFTNRKHQYLAHELSKQFQLS